jgi:hypothetical protein
MNYKEVSKKVINVTHAIELTPREELKLRKVLAEALDKVNGKHSDHMARLDRIELVNEHGQGYWLHVIIKEVKA